ncbi:MAG: hypothetical protein ORN54_05270, partial [Cyclobacteriaceae bacterium]|nr:hypothetical protein [Cyclobacteriaceae bacterium]
REFPSACFHFLRFKILTNFYLNYLSEKWGVLYHELQTAMNILKETTLGVEYRNNLSIEFKTQPRT